MIWTQDQDLTIYQGDCLEILRGMADDSIDACVTSPPYLDARPEYDSPTVSDFGRIFIQVRRVVTGPMVMNVGRLWRKGKELRWWEPLLTGAELAGLDLLDTLIWAKPNANPIQGKYFTNAHEYCFVLGDPKLELDVTEIRTEYSPETIARYGRKFEAQAGVKNQSHSERRTERLSSTHEDGARPRSYVEIYTGREKGNPHPAPMALELACHLVKFSAPAGGVVLDPFGGSGTTAVAARMLGRQSVLIEKSVAYCTMAADRLAQQTLLS